MQTPEYVNEQRAFLPVIDKLATQPCARRVRKESRGNQCRRRARRVNCGRGDVPIPTKNDTPASSEKCAIAYLNCGEKIELVRLSNPSLLFIGGGHGRTINSHQHEATKVSNQSASFGVQRTHASQRESLAHFTIIPNRAVRRERPGNALLRRDEPERSFFADAEEHRCPRVSSLTLGTRDGKDAVPSRWTRELDVKIAPACQLCFLQAHNLDYGAQRVKECLDPTVPQLTRDPVLVLRRHFVSAARRINELTQTAKADIPGDDGDILVRVGRRLRLGSPRGHSHDKWFLSRFAAHDNALLPVVAASRGLCLARAHVHNTKAFTG